MKNNLFDNAMEVDVSEKFIFNSNCIKYPYRSKPPVILSSEELKIDITFNRLDRTLTSMQAKAAIKSILMLLQKRGDIKKISDYHFFHGQNVKGYWIFFVNRGIHGDYYNYLAVFPIHNRFTVGTLSAEYANRKVGRIVFLDMIESVKDQTRGFLI